MNCCWNFLENSKVQVVVPRGPTLLPSAPFTLYVHVAVNRSLRSSLPKHAFDMQEIVAPVSKKDTVWLLLILTGKLAAYLVSLSLTWLFHFSHSESETESMILSELSTSRVGWDIVSFCCYVIRCAGIRSNFIYLCLVIMWFAFMFVWERCAQFTLMIVSVIKVWWVMFKQPLEIFHHLSSGFQQFSHLVWFAGWNWKL